MPRTIAVQRPSAPPPACELTDLAIRRLVIRLGISRALAKEIAELANIGART
jgi:hypothetical protein